jgi:dihydroorotate dehydrogenase subfamily 2
MLDFAYPVTRSLLFSMDAENAHHLTLGALSKAPRLLGAVAASTMGPPPASLAREVAGLKLAGPIGLAAGLDKDGVAVPFWPSLGFGFIEMGTVTAHPQPGNPRPRMFRLVNERALINRMGFNNRGSADLANRLRALREAGHWPSIPVGVNIGKSKITPLEEATEDYVTSTKRLAGLADYFTVNVSSPNTPGLRSLQDRDTLATLLPPVMESAGGAPVFLKLAPDLAPEGIADLVELACELGVSGIVASNTTIRRDVLSADPGEAGGLSGRPLWPCARTAIQTALDTAGARIPVIGVGGIEEPTQVNELLDAGCAAVQVYTAFVYQGPGLPSRLNRGISS